MNVHRQLLLAMPVQDVAVSVVGKYRYHMLSPSENNRVPVLVDIILVGRTKIITLHSGMWVDNRTDKNLTFRLHVPVTPLTAPAAGRAGSRSDTVIGPVRPDKGDPPPPHLPPLTAESVPDQHSSPQPEASCGCVLDSCEQVSQAVFLPSVLDGMSHVFHLPTLEQATPTGFRSSISCPVLGMCWAMLLATSSAR